ncbi:MAG: L-sorbosone dehydrogenase [Rubripirellula sp.]|nr:L-sorbosone dehydrogenase [Rubripirellula sp.]
MLFRFRRLRNVGGYLALQDWVIHVLIVHILIFASQSAIAQRGLTKIPDPDPVAELAAMQVHELAEVNLFAADPDFTKPTQINFDSSGALWIASSEVYPQIKPGEVANDKIIVLRDTDGDGISDQRTVFADGLLIPTGVVPVSPSAAYVAEGTRLLFLRDTDQDGIADERRVVLSGFGTEDTHHLIHTLRMGPDGCLYFNQSIYIHSHIETAYGTRHLDGGGIWRYRPTTGELEVVCKGFVNPWGHVFDAVGESFATDGAFFEGINFVFPDSVFVTSPGATKWLKGLNPGSPKHCGLEVLSGTHIPEDWNGDLITNDFRSHRVCRFTIKPSASGYISRQQPELITTQHVAFRPIDVRMGPDGAIYIADWYNPIIQHGEVDFRDERRDREHGRIWRLSFSGRPLDPWPKFSELNLGQLLLLLNDPALKVRQFARQQLWQHASESPRRVIEAATHWAAVNEERGALELSWLQEVVSAAKLGENDQVDAVDASVRRTYLRSLWRRRLNADLQSRQELERAVIGYTSDEDARVRLEAVISVGQLDATEHPNALLGVLSAARMEVDRNLEFAIWQSIRKLNQANAGGALLRAHDWREKPDDLARAVAAIGTPAAAEVATEWLEAGEALSDSLVNAVALAGNGDQLGRIVRLILRNPDAILSRLKPLLERTKRDGTIPANVGPAFAAAATRWLDQPALVGKLASVTGAWKVVELEQALLRAVRESSGFARSQLIESLGAFETESVRSALQALAADVNPETRVAATKAIATRRPEAAVDLIANLLADRTTASGAMELVAEQMNRREMPERLAAAIRKCELPTDRARGLLRRIRRAGGNVTLEAAIRIAGNLDAAAWQLSPEFRAEMLRLVRSEGDANRGEAIYRRDDLQCIQCHAIGVGGGLVGPNLISVGGSSQPDYILESLLDPSAKLKEGYTTLTVLTVDGEVVNGIVIGRSDDAIRLRLADGKEVRVAANQIEQEKPGQSLMPVGLLDTLTKSELVDLTAFLAALGRDPAFMVSTEPLMRQFDVLIDSPQATQRLNRSIGSAVSDPALQWRAMTTRVDGRLPIEELDSFGQLSQAPVSSFIRLRLKMPTAGVAKVIAPVKGLRAWVDAKPTPAFDLNSLKLDRGEHIIVLAIDRSVQVMPFAIRIEGDAIGH